MSDTSDADVGPPVSTNGKSLALSASNTDVYPQPALDQELGVSMAMPFSVPAVLAGIGNYDTGNAQVLLRRSDISVRQLVDMRAKDGQSRSLYRLMTLPIRAALLNASWVPATDGEAEQEFIQAMFDLPAHAGGMETTWHRFIAQVLLGLFDGFSAFEFVFQVPETGDLKGKITLKKMAYRPSDTVFFIVDDHGNFNGFQQKTVFQGRPIDVFVEPDYAFYYAANEEENPMYGVSFFHSAFYHYDKKVKLYYLAHLAAQHRAVGTRVGKIPRGANHNEKEAFRRALSDFGLAQAMLVPDGYSVDELAKSMQTFDFLGLIDHHDKQMARSVLAFFVNEDKPTRLVDFSSSEDDMFLLMERAIMDEVAGLINSQIVPRFIDWNFGSGKYPQFQFGAFTDEQKAAIRTTFNALAVAPQTNVTPEFMFQIEKIMADELGLDIDYDDIQARIEAENALEQKAKTIGLENAIAAGKDGPPAPGYDAQAKQGPDIKPRNPPGSGNLPPAPKGPSGQGGSGSAPAASSNAQVNGPGNASLSFKVGSPGYVSLSELARSVLEELGGNLSDS